MALKWKPAMVSRLPEKDQHEQVKFVFECVRDDDEDQHDIMMGRHEEVVVE